MRRLLLGTAISLATASAVAADLPPAGMPLYTKAPIYDPVYNWTGFYVGGNVGYSWGNWDSTNPSGIANFPGPAGTASPHVNGWLGGLQAGYNMQRGTFVFGLEGDIQITGEQASDDGTSTSVAIPVAVTGNAFNAGCRPVGAFAGCTAGVTNSWNFPWFSTFRGRVGWTADPSLLLYVTGGLAVGAAEYANSTLINVAVTSNSSGGMSLPLAGLSSALSDRVTRAGIAVGGGIEKAFDRNLSAKAEYLYLDLGTNTFLPGTGFDTSVRLRDHIVRIGVNYKFAPCTFGQMPC